MVDYKDLSEKISKSYAAAPFFLDKVKFKDLLHALELCQVLENEPGGLTLKEINKRTPRTIFTEDGLEVFENNGVIEKGVIVTAIHFKNKTKELKRGEALYYLTSDNYKKEETKWQTI